MRPRGRDGEADRSSHDAGASSYPLAGQVVGPRDVVRVASTL